MEEGSVMVDGVNPDMESESTDEVEVESVEETTTEKSEDVNTTQEEVTEKGTKLDPNPLSRAHQIAANERAKARQYEALLNDPVKLRSYMAQFEPQKEEVKEEEKEEDLSWIQTDADLQKYLKEKTGQLEEKLEKKFTGIQQEQQRLKQQEQHANRVIEVANTVDNEIKSVQEKYPELNPKSPAYSPELDEAVSELFNASDFDPVTNTFMGKVSLLGVADRIMGATRVAQERASKQAQTKVLDRTTSRVRTGSSSSSEEVDTSKMSASQLIAHRIQQAAKQRK